MVKEDVRVEFLHGKPFPGEIEPGVLYVQRRRHWSAGMMRCPGKSKKCGPFIMRIVEEDNPCPPPNWRLFCGSKGLPSLKGGTPGTTGSINLHRHCGCHFSILGGKILNHAEKAAKVDPMSQENPIPAEDSPECGA